MSDLPTLTGTIIFGPAKTEGVSDTAGIVERLRKAPIAVGKAMFEAHALLRDAAVEIERLSAELERTMESPMQTDREQTLERLLTEANGLIRSFSAVCDREGRETNWEGLKMQVRRALAEQHQVMHPDQYVSGPRAG